MAEAVKVIVLLTVAPPLGEVRLTVCGQAVLVKFAIKFRLAFTVKP